MNSACSHRWLPATTFTRAVAERKAIKIAKPIAAMAMNARKSSYQCAEARAASGDVEK